MKEPINIQIDVNQNGFGKIIIDGKDYSRNVRSVEVYARVGESTRVTVEFAEVGLSFSGAYLSEKDE